ncbi:hypothetical protein [Latilactobacillus sakei]|nr:hypothetical protein [Latilactobacillus sakei]SPS03571.1 hypothetical protein LAS9624_00387 [Latilactobacillus sakei]
MSKPDYIRHQLSEDQITIDWYWLGHVSDSHRGNSRYLSNP